MAGYIKENIWHESRKIHPQNNGSIIFETKIVGTDEIRFWIMTRASKAAALEMEALRQGIRSKAEKTAKR